MRWRRVALTGGTGAPKEAAAAVKRHLQGNLNVVGVRATYLFRNGQLSDQKGVVIKVRPEASRDPKDYGLEEAIGGVPISIEMADLESLAGALAPEALESLAGALAPEALEAPATMQAYKRSLSDPRFNLDPVTDNMTLTLHVSPEAGWRELAKFFEGDDYERITVGMYNFTAPHIIDAIRTAVEPNSRQMTLTLDRKSDDLGGGTKKDDWPEEKVMKTLKHDAGEIVSDSSIVQGGQPEAVLARLENTKIRSCFPGGEVNEAVLEGQCSR